MKALACLLISLLCTHASARSFSDDEKTILYNFQYLAFSKAWCEEYYIFDMTVPMSVKNEIGTSTKDKAFQRIIVDAATDVDNRIQSLGVKKHCALLYSWIGGERHGDIMIRR